MGLLPEVTEGLSGWERVCLARAAANLRESALRPDLPSFHRPAQHLARKRAEQWLLIAVKGSITKV